MIHDLASNATPMGAPLAYVAGEDVGSSAVMEGIRKGVAWPFGRLMNVRRKVGWLRCFGFVDVWVMGVGYSIQGKGIKERG